MRVGAGARGPAMKTTLADRHPEVVARLRARLVRFAAETGAELHFTP